MHFNCKGPKIVKKKLSDTMMFYVDIDDHVDRKSGAEFLEESVTESVAVFVAESVPGSVAESVSESPTHFIAGNDSNISPSVTLVAR